MDSLVQLNDANDFFSLIKTYNNISCSNFMYPIIRNKNSKQKGKQSSENTSVFISYRHRDLLSYGKALKSTYS